MYTIKGIKYFMKKIQFNPLTRKNRKDKAKYPDINIIQTNLHSEDTFNIYDFPTHELGKGNHSFLIYGSENLQSGSEIQIEILDNNDEPISVKTLLLNDLEPAWIVTFKIQNDTEDGPATIYIVGTGKGSTELNNIMWSRTVSVNKNVNNKSNIIFLETTDTTVTENVVMDTVHQNKYRTYISSSFTDLETVSGQVDLIRGFYYIEGSGEWNELSSIVVSSTDGINDNTLQSKIEFIEFNRDDNVKFK